MFPESKHRIFLLTFLLFFSSLVFSDSQIPKNLIFVIVDGMGPATITATRLYKNGSEYPLNLEKFPNAGYAKTYSNNQYVTDSAAAATALASGVKADNGNIGVSPLQRTPEGHFRELPTLIDLAQQHGKKTGIISTARITDATPACFYAHVKDRSNQEAIAAFLPDSKVDLIFGGGKEYFFPNSMKDTEYKNQTGQRTDGKNLLEELKARYTYVESQKDFDALTPQTPLPVCGLFQYGHMHYEYERKKDKFGEPSLKDMVSKAISILKAQSPNGYVLVVESARVDHAAHANKTKFYLEEMLMVDALAPVLLAESEDTLIVLTADHETGGFTLNGYVERSKMRQEHVLDTFPFLPWGPLQWATKPSAAHTAVDVPVLSAGPGSSNFLGYMENTDILKRVNTAFRWQ